MRILFVVGLLLLASFSSAALQQANEETIYLEKITPYMKIIDGNILVFDEKTARNVGLDDAYIRFTTEYVDYNNKMICSFSIMTEEQNFCNSAFSHTEFQIISNKYNQSSDYAKELGRLFAKANAGSGVYKSASDGIVCGGSRDMPHTCPARRESGIYYSSLSSLSSMVRSAGYHNTYWPGCGSSDYRCDRDFTRWTGAYGCSSSSGALRYQLSARQSGTRWTYWTQGVEPNPEILSYSWPVWWWGGYVNWWHTEWPQPDGRRGC
ncbi:MAG: hypothetical protein ABIJ34_00015 [archaeon]|nr:hypothetical protein [Candidatus Micrarchaeota archaeon]